MVVRKHVLSTEMPVSSGNLPFLRLFVASSDIWAWRGPLVVYAAGRLWKQGLPLMSACLSIVCPSDGLPEAVFAALRTDLWPQFVEVVSKPVSIAIFAAGLLGLLVGWLARGGGRRAPEPAAPETGMEELRWRHEKLVLTERQLAEKQQRLEAFAVATAKLATPEEKAVALQVHLLAERMREARMKVGSDLSRMAAVKDRLGAVPGVSDRGRDAVSASREMAASQWSRLDETRELLRGIGDEVTGIEETMLSGALSSLDAAGLRKRLMDLKGWMLELPHGWAVSTGETDRRIRELLATVDEPGLAPVRDVLLVDGSLTASLSGDGGIDLPGAVTSLIAVLDRKPERTQCEATQEPRLLTGLPQGEPEAKPFPDFGFPDPVKPDDGFRDPAEFAKPEIRLGGGFHDLTLGLASGPEPEEATSLISADPEPQSDSGSEDGERTMVLFCSNNVELWGTTVYRGARCRARAVDSFPEWARWISICRLDTHERVFAPIQSTSLRSGQSSDAFGFNGSNELFYGARHLGLFSESCPNEVETRFTYGGWGFGHRAHEIAPDVEQLQAAGWEGREIPADTVFEIVVHEELPALGSLDRLLESGEVTGIA